MMVGVEFKGQTKVLYNALRNTPEASRLEGKLWADENGSKLWNSTDLQALISSVICELQN